MELVKALDEGHQHQAQGNHGLQGDTQQFVGHHTQDLEDRVEVPLRKDFQRGGEGISLVSQHGRIKNGQAHHTSDGAKDHHREDVEEIVRPGGLAVIVVAHALGELGAQLGIVQIRFLEDVHRWKEIKS